MPINLQELNDQTQKTVITTKYPPKAYHKLLTGTGGKVGFLCEQNNPMVNKYIGHNNDSSIYYLKDHRVVKNIDRYIIPVSLARTNVSDCIMTLPDTAFCATTLTQTSYNNVYIYETT